MTAGGWVERWVGVKLKGVGSTTESRRLSTAAHVALVGDLVQRTAVGETVTAVALSTVFNSGVEEAHVLTDSETLGDGHVVGSGRVSGQGAAWDFLNTSGGGCLPSGREVRFRSRASWGGRGSRRRSRSGNSVGIGVELKSVGSTTENLGVTSTRHVALSGNQVERSTVNERVATEALGAEFDGGELEAPVATNRDTLGDSHVIGSLGVAGQSAARDLLDTVGGSGRPTGGQVGSGLGSRGGDGWGGSGTSEKTDSVGSTTDLGRVTVTLHGASARLPVERSTVAERVGTVAFTSKFETGKSKTLGLTESSALVDGHVVTGSRSSTESSTGDFFNARGCSSLPAGRELGLESSGVRVLSIGSGLGSGSSSLGEIFTDGGVDKEVESTGTTTVDRLVTGTGHRTLSLLLE